MKKKIHLILALSILFTGYAAASAFRGTIKNQAGEALPFASIFVKNTSLGTNSNENGEFSITLEKGNYTIIFRYLGYETLSKNINIGDTDVSENIVLKPTVILLKEATVGNGKEDPALTIMRKTVAISEIHFKELATYNFRAYVKGNMKVLDAPFLAEKLLEKQFIKLNQLYVFEFVNEVAFKAPNTLSQRVKGRKDNLPPTLRNSLDLHVGVGKFGFADPTNETSPITEKGVKKYNFEYLGYFEENGRIINKIKVTPKKNAVDLNEGILNIVDGTWYVHSYDFKSRTDNGTTNSKVTYELIDDVWIPNNFSSSAKVSAYGFDLEVNAVVANKDLKFTKNPKYATFKPKLIDEKLLTNQKVDKTEIKRPNKSKDELTLQEIMALKKQFEKEDKIVLKKNKTDDISSIRNYVVDSLATQKDSTFWAIERQVPLTKIEIEGFVKADSIVAANSEAINKKMAKDSTKKTRPNKFKPTHLIGGTTYQFHKITDSSSTYYKNNLILGSVFEDTRFNAVEGYTIGVPKVSYQRNFSETDYLNFGVKTYYSFKRERLNGDAKITYKTERLKLTSEAGRRVFQLNENEPINPFLNAYFALLQGIHYAKFYENSYFKTGFVFTPNARWNMGSNVRFSNRSFLENTVNYGWRDKAKRFEPNRFLHTNGTLSAFRNNRLTELNFNVTFAPRGSVSYDNNKKKLSNQNSPSFTLSNTFAFGNGAYNLLDFTAIHTQEIGKSSLTSKINTGFFYGSTPTYLLDYKHFEGNLLIATTADGFRNLDYYLFSSDKNYFTIFNTFKANKLLFTALPFIKKKGVKEYLFQNSLVNPYIKHHEIGYGIGIININFEVIADYNNGKYNSTFFRIRGGI